MIAPIQAELLVKSMFQGALPSRQLDAHKGTFGSVAIIGGAEGMMGALLLAARAVLLSGAGRVYAASVSADPLSVDLHYPEIMMRQPDTLMQLQQLDCVVIGPGLGQSDTALALLEFWIKQAKPILLDADALNLIAKHSHLRVLLQSRQAEVAMTPHMGEAARLLQCSTAEIQQNRIDSAIMLANRFKAICVLKGPGTVCAHPDGRCYVNTSGNPGLATGGTGDVLSGVIAALIAQGLSVLDAAKMGVFVHGAAADALVQKGIGPVGLTASEVATEVRNVIHALN